MLARIPARGFQALNDQDSLLILEHKEDISDIRFEECIMDEPFLFLLADPESSVIHSEFIGLRIQHLESLLNDLERTTGRTFLWQRMGLGSFLHDIRQLLHPSGVPSRLEPFYAIAREIGVYTDPFTLVPADEQRKTA